MRTDMSDDPTTLFTRQHEAYRRGRPGYPDALYTRLVALLPRPLPRTLAWDCGCGSGQASRALAERFDRVVATDVSQSQLDAATPDARISYLLALAHDVRELADQSVALITAATAFHWFEERAFYREAWRVICPAGGVLAIWSYAEHQVVGAQAIDAWTSWLARELLAPYWMPQNIDLMTHGYTRARRPAEDATEVTERVFGGEDRLVSRASMSLSDYLHYLGSWSASQRFLEDQGESISSRFGGEVEALWREAFGSEEARAVVEWPLFGRVFQRG